MSSVTTSWIMNLVDRISGPMKNVQANADKAAEKVKKVSAIDISAIGNAFNNLAGRIDAISQPGAAFNAQQKDLQALTGVSEQQLNMLGDSARKTAKIFGGDASAQMEAYKTTLSRLGPDLAKTPAAVDAIGNHIQTLSKTMKNDAVGATNAITTAMLQYQTDLSDPIKASKEAARMMNVMAAGAKYGAAEVPQISAALEQTGVQAKLAKLSFEETNAAIQALAQGGKYASEAGVALRNVLTRMSAPSSLSKEAVAELDRYHVNIRKIADASIPWAERLKELAPIQNDINALSAVFGTENAANAQILIRSSAAQAEMTAQITGTNTATEQAAIVMSSHNERMARMKAWLEDLKIGFFNVAGSITPYVSGIAQGISVLADLKNAQQGAKMMMDALRASTILSTIATKAVTVATTVFNAVWRNSPISRVITIISALIGVVVLCYNHFETFRGFVHGSWEALKEFGSMLTEMVTGRIKELMSGIVGVGHSLYLLFTGEFRAAADAGKKALLDITGLGTVQKTMEGGKRIANAYKSGFQSQMSQSPTLAQAIEGGMNRSGVLSMLEKMGIRGGSAYLNGFISQARKIAAWMDGMYRNNIFSTSLEKNIARFSGTKPKEEKPSGNGNKTENFPALAPLLPGGSGGGGSKKSKKGSESGDGLSISGGGSKNISMNMTIKNYFNVSGKLDVQRAAEEVAGILDARLRDSAVALLG